MKRFAFLCIFLLFVHYSMQVPRYENCLSEVLPAADQHRCVKVICTSQNEYKIEQCSCTKKAHLGNLNAEYPACCPQCCSRCCPWCGRFGK